MKISMIWLAVGAVGCLVWLVACKRGGIQADVDAAIAQGQFQFVALINDEGKITYPQVPEIPDWYFQTTGTRIRTVRAETKNAEAAYMKSYNEALYQELKAQGNFQTILDNVAKVETNLENAKK